MKKTLVIALCALLAMTAGIGALPQKAHAGGIVDAIVSFIAAPMFLLDPLTSLVIIDAFTCQVNIIWGCDSNGAPLPEPLPVIDFTSPAVVELPNPVTVTWSANARAVSCLASGEWGGIRPLSGSVRTISPTTRISIGTHTYALTCKNSEGGSTTATTSTRIIGPSVSLTTPLVVSVPDPIKLHWESQNAVSCDASGDWRGIKGLMGDETIIDPTTTGARGTYTYRLACANSSGSVATSSVTVRVIQIPKCSFGATPEVITPPQSSKLEWRCDYATACSIDQGIGSVNQRSGSRTVLPSTTTAYTLECRGIDGSRTFPATVGIPGTGGVPSSSGSTSTPKVIEVNP